MELPDQTCFLCKNPITDEKWTVVNEKAYHNNCMECGKCKKRVGFSKFTLNENVAICGECDADGAGAVAVSDSSQGEHNSRQCWICKSTTGKRLLRGGQAYCPNCYRCNHCQLLMGTDNCLMLLDMLFCYGCEREYNAKKFILAKCGSGPLVLTFLQ